MRRTFAHVALFALSALLLAGCSSGSAPRVSAATSAVTLAPAPTLTPITTLPTRPTQTPTPQPTPLVQQWIPLASQAPSDIVAAAKKADFFQTVATGGGDSPSLDHLGTPLYVQSLSTSYSAALPDYYDIPILNDSGAVIGSVDCELNAGHTAISVGVIVQYGQPRTSGSVAQITVRQALAEIAVQHHVGPKAGTQPQLIYFPFNQRAEDTGQINWKGGGNSMDDPMWEFVGTDGNQHFAGDDGHAYYWNELPLAP